MNLDHSGTVFVFLKIIFKAQLHFLYFIYNFTEIATSIIRLKGSLLFDCGTIHKSEDDQQSLNHYSFL